jgi:hypothetical protein
LTLRHIDSKTLLGKVFATPEGQEKQARLIRAQNKAITIPASIRGQYIRKNGPNKWKPIKDLITPIVGNKCWYTETEIIGSPLVVDHFRPICDYWWLSYNPFNYRVACHWSNSSQTNSLYDCVGGKGDNFPLLAPGIRALNEDDLGNERPVILDPCNEIDCRSLAFQADGRPVLNPLFKDDEIMTQRVEQSKILLNLDHPDFNSKRAQLCSEISQSVATHEELPEISVNRNEIKIKLTRCISPDAPYSSAARYYLMLHRHLVWVQNILDT